MTFTSFTDIASTIYQIILSWLRAMELASAYAVAKQRR
ncbi:hypothetical protein SOVF_038800 [Spinacia oleracea]|nr:hypothetical protein SOVF_038800 [Spinacia oleracea]